MHSLCLELHEFALRKVRPGDTYGITLVEPQCLHHPLREVDDALLLTVAATINGIMDNGVPSDVSDYVSSTTAVSSLTDSDRSDIESD